MTTSDAGEGRTFEELMAELESVTEQLAAGDLGIESAADLYERACALHELAQQRLEQVKSRVDRLSLPSETPPEPGSDTGAGRRGVTA
jgi:exodeoxyribonuclease VII small subunit